MTGMMDIDELKDKRIAVLLSGGVDSSVVVYEFARLGLHPDCFYIKIGPEETEEWDCSSDNPQSPIPKFISILKIKNI